MMSSALRINLCGLGKMRDARDDTTGTAGAPAAFCRPLGAGPESGAAAGGREASIRPPEAMGDGMTPGVSEAKC